MKDVSKDSLQSKPIDLLLNLWIALHFLEHPLFFSNTFKGSYARSLLLQYTTLQESHKVFILNLPFTMGQFSHPLVFLLHRQPLPLKL